MKASASATLAPPAPHPRLSLGVTGHRSDNPALSANRDRVEAAMAAIFDVIEAAARAAGTGVAPAATRLHCLLADGVDLVAAGQGQRRGWELVAPLPFGRALNLAINALPTNLEAGRALLAGTEPGEPSVAARATAIAAAADGARCFELAERDEVIGALFLDHLADPGDRRVARTFEAHAAERVALAARVMIEQSDLLIAVWDGASRAAVGGTGYTIACALEYGAPVIWIDATAPEDWRILRAPEALVVPRGAVHPDREDALARLVAAALRSAPDADAAGVALGREAWRPRSSRLWTAYRRIEALFGGGRPLRSLRQDYESPAAIAAGSGAPLLAAARHLPDADRTFVDRLDDKVLRRFAWADGISAHLSDSYRGGMVISFLFSAAAIISGIAYQPVVGADQKWIFAIVEFLLLAAILLITWLGQRRRWHTRWFETRRVAEYLRHAPMLLLLGVARPPGRWPQGSDTSWPEYYARHSLRGLGLPRVVVTGAYLRAVLATLLDEHIVRQRDYHEAKARRLTTVHHRLDRLSERSFMLAVASVATYLSLAAAAALGLLARDWLDSTGKLFTFLGVFFPTVGAAIAGIRYFGDFERFATISRVTSEKLDAVHGRVSLLLAAPEECLDYARVTELAHAADDIVVSEIENWQAVFGGKHITVPA